MKNTMLTPLLCLAVALCLGAPLPVRAADAAQTDEHRYALLAADSSTGRIARIVVDGEAVWERSIRAIHDLHLLPNGNIVIGNCHAGPDSPQIIEVTRDKEVVWSFHDFDRFGDALSNSQVVGEDAQPYHR